MKKVLIAAVIMAFSFNVQAQIRLGIKAGANMTKIIGKAFKEEFELGYHAGAFAEIQLNKSIGIQPEVLFNQVKTEKATTFDAVYNNWQNSITSIQLNYLTIPVLLRINVNDLVSLNLGPQFGILMSKDESVWQNGKQAVKSGDLSAVGGVTINLKMLRAFGRYVIGLNNINDISNSDSWKSQQIQLGIGLKL